MAFPQSTLPVRVRIAPGGLPAADPATWVWIDVSAYVRADPGIRISEGRSDEGQKVDPGKCELTFDNRTGDFSTRNVLGKWYGKLAKGTPLRVGTIAVADSFTRTSTNGFGSTDTGQAWNIGGTASEFSVGGGVAQLAFSAANIVKVALPAGTELLDVDAQFTVSVPAVMLGASQAVGMYLRYLDTSNHYILACEFNPGGTVTAKIRRALGGVSIEVAALGTVPGLTYTAGQKLRVRVQADGPALRIKIWADSSNEPTSWTLVTSDDALPNAGLIGIWAWRVAGNTNTSPLVVSIDDFEAEAIEFTGTVPDWQPRWDKSRKDATTPITAAGILRRLQQGKSPLRSPITRMMIGLNPIAYWPLEDESSATVSAPGIPNLAVGPARSVEFAQETPVLLGAKQTAGITASTVMSGVIPRRTATGAWSFVFFAYLLAPPAANTRIMTVYSTGAVRVWAVELDSTALWLRGYDADNTMIIEVGTGYPAVIKPPAWVAYDLYVFQTGGNVTGRLLQYGVHGDTGVPTMYLMDQTVTGSAGSPTSWTAQGSLGFNQGRLAHIAAFNYELPFVSYKFANAANGYLGETASDRITRLCLEENVQVVVEDGTSEPLGPQRTDTFLNLLYAAEAADLGILYERGAGLAYRPRGARYNRPVELPFDFAVGAVAEPPEPADDDQQLRNQWTVTRDGGSSAVAIDQDSIDTTGLIDETATINVATDDVLQDHATFRLITTTVDEYRWPKIVLNLARNTSQIRLWRAAAPFPRMTIANEPSQVAGNAVDVTVLGHSQTLTPYGWDIELNCAPTYAWKVGVYDVSRYDSASTTLAAPGANTTSTSWAISTADARDVWATTGLPYSWLVDGERVTVTAMTTASGSGPYTQTATVTRSVNGIVTTHAAGAPIHLADPARYAL